MLTVAIHRHPCDEEDNRTPKARIDRSATGIVVHAGDLQTYDGHPEKHLNGSEYSGDERRQQPFPSPARRLVIRWLQHAVRWRTFSSECE